MGAFSQLKLTLWKHITIRKRQPITLLLEFLWPVVVFAMIASVRHLFPPEPRGDCAYKARALPSAGLLPFAQSFLCNLENKCNNISSYEEIPNYKDAKLGPLVNKFYPLIQREDVQTVLDELPTTMALASHAVKSLDTKPVRKVLSEAIRIEDLFKDQNALKSYLINNLNMDGETIGHLFAAEINIGQLLVLLPSVGMKEMVCQSKLLGQVLNFPNASDAEASSKMLCSLLDTVSPSTIQKLIMLVDVKSLIEKGAVILNGLGSENVADVLTGVGDIVDALQDIPILSSLAKVPISADTEELTDYLQSALEFLNTLKGLNLDLNFLGEMMDDIEYIVGPNEFISHVKAVGKHVHRLIVWSQTGVLESTATQLTVSDILKNRKEFTGLLRNKTSLSEDNIDTLMDVKIKSNVLGNEDFCYKLCDAITPMEVISFEGAVEMPTLMQLWTLVCHAKNCKTFIQEDFGAIRPVSSGPSAMTVETIATELEDLLNHTNYLGSKMGATFKKAFPAFDVLWKVTTTALSVAFLPEWNLNNSSFVNSLASTLETLPGYLPEEMRLPVLNLVTAADVTLTVAVIIARKASEVDQTLYNKLVHDPDSLQKMLSFGPEVMTSLAKVFSEQSTFDMLLERPEDIQSLICNVTLTKVLLDKSSEENGKVLEEFLCSLPIVKMTEAFTSIRDRENLVKTVEQILLANDREDVDTAFAHRVRSLCLQIYELIQITKNSTKDSDNWNKLLLRLNVEGQNFLEPPWKLIKERLETIKYGSILNVYTSTLGRSLDKKKFVGREEKVMAQVGIMINAITEEALAVPQGFLRNLANYWPSIIRVFLESLADPNKVRAVVSTLTWSEVVCNETAKDAYLTISKNLDKPEFTEFFCNLTIFVEKNIFQINWFEKPFVKMIKKLSDGKTKPGEVTKINWTKSLEGVRTMLHRYGRFVARSLEHADEVGRLTERSKIVFSKMNVTNIVKFSVSVVTTVLQFIDRQLETIQPWVWKHIKALIFVVDMLVQYFNTELEKILVENKVETGVLTFNLPILTKMMRKVVRLFPEFMHAFADLLTSRLGDFIGRLFQVIRSDPVPCDGLSLTNLLDFRGSGGMLVRDMEKFACTQWKFMLSEIIQYPMMFKLLWKFREASQDKDLLVNWTQTSENAQLLVDQAADLTRFKGTIFPDVEGFTVDNANAAIDRFVNAVMINTTERGLRFLLLIGDALVPLFENILKTGELTNASSVAQLLHSIHNESFSKEQRGEVAWFTFKTVMKTADIVLTDLVHFFENFKDDNVTLSSIFGQITLTGIFEAFPDYVNTLIHSILRPEFPKILDELRINGSLSFSDLCDKPAVLDRLVITPNHLQDVNRTIVLDTACRLLSKPFHYFALEPYIYSWAIKSFDKVVTLWSEQDPRNTIVHFVDIVDGIEFMALRVRDIVSNATDTKRYFQDLFGRDRWEIVGHGLFEAVVNAQMESWLDMLKMDLSTVQNIGTGRSLLVAQLLKVTNATIAAIGRGLDGAVEPTNTLTLSDVLVGSSEFQSFVAFLEMHVADIIQIVAHTLTFQPQKVKPLLDSLDWQNSICSSPATEYFSSSQTMNLVLMESVKEEFCSHNLTGLLNASTTEEMPIGFEDFVSVSGTFVRFVQQLGRFRYKFPDSHISSTLLHGSLWQNAVEEITLEQSGPIRNGEGSHARAVTEKILENLLNLDDEKANLKTAIQSMDTMISGTLKTVDFMQMPMNESIWKTLRALYGGKPQVQTVINIIEDIPSMTAVLVNTILNPPKLHALLEKLLTLAKPTPLSEFCSDLHFNDFFDFPPGVTVSFSDVQQFICATDWKQFAIDVNPFPMASAAASNANFNTTSFATKIASLYKNVVGVSELGLPYLEANYTDLPWINKADWKFVIAVGERFAQKIENKSQLIATSIQYVSLVELIPEWSEAETYLQLVNLQIDAVLQMLNVTKDPVSQRRRKLYDIITDVNLLLEAVDQIHVGVKRAADLAVRYAFLRQLKYFEKFPNETSYFCATYPKDQLDLSSIEKQLNGQWSLSELFQRFCESPPSQWTSIMMDELKIPKENVKSIVENIMIVLPSNSPWFTDPQWSRSIPFDWATFSHTIHYLDDLCREPPTDFYPEFLWTSWQPAFKAFGQVLPKMIALSGETVCPTMPWINYAPFTGLIQLVDKQVLLAPEYERFLCDFPRMNLTSIYHRLKNNLDLVETLKELRVHLTVVSLNRIHEPSGQSTTCPVMFNATSRLSDSLNDLVVDYVESDTRIQRIKDCFQEDTQAAVINEIDKYLKLMSKAMPLLNLPNITSLTDSMDLRPLVENILNYVKGQVPVYVFTKTILKSIKSLDGNSSGNPVFMTLVDGSININRVRFSTKGSHLKERFEYGTLYASHYDPSEIAKIFCNSTRLAKFALPPAGVSTDSIVHELSQNLCKDGDLDAGRLTAENFVEMIDRAKVRTMLPALQMQTLLSWNVVMAVGRRIGSLGETMVEIKGAIGDLDFDQLTANITLRHVVEIVVPLIYAENLTLLANGMDIVNEDLRPLIYGSYFEEDLMNLASGVHSIYNFMDKSLRNHTFQLIELLSKNGTREMVDFLESKSLKQDTVEVVMNLNMNLSVLIFDIQLTKLEKLFCDTSIMGKVFNISSNPTAAGLLYGALCSRDDSDASTVIDIYFDNIDFQQLLIHEMRMVLDGIAEKAGVDPDDAFRAIVSLLGAKDLFPVLLNELKTLQEEGTLLDIMNQLDPEKLARGEISSALISVTGDMLCGHPIRSFDEYFRLIQSSTDKPPEAKDRAEMKALPTKFCQTLYQQIAYRPAGSVIWGFVKPLLQGKILFAPNDALPRKIMTEANQTFAGLAKMITMTQRWTKGFARLGDFVTNQLTTMEDILSLPLAKSVVEGLMGPQITNAVLNLSSTLEKMGNPQRFLGAASALGEGLECFEMNRMIGYDSEQELAKAAMYYQKQGIFMAGIVFTNLSDNERTKRQVLDENISTNDSLYVLPPHITYKIRMDIDGTPSTKRLKTRYWKPGPEDDFLENMRYLRGFVEVQDMVDQAIVRLQVGRDVQLPGTYLQQFPYHCHWSDEFGFMLRSSLPAITTLAWIFIIAFFVRELVLDREMMLEQIMHVMGLNAWVSWLSWFISCFVVMLVTNVSIVLILKYGSVFPNSDPSVLFVFFFTFAISSIMFCYLVSIWFKTATVAAITAVLLYMTSYSPFIIVVIIEAHLSLVQRILMNLLMSTSFGQGCLYITRFEAQEQGIQWGNIWDSPIPNDDMSFAWCCILMAIDAAIYFILAAYFSAVISVFHRSDRIRIRYLFWPVLPNSPSQLGKSNQLLSETDSFGKLRTKLKDGSLPAVDNKSNGNNNYKVGISLQNLRKVYNLGKSNEKVAIEGLSLEFYEGQITTVLGQNGAGKTTTINMLTGQFPPLSGWATIYGRDVVYEFDEIRKNLGICPQYNLLFNLLTVREHLEFYARLKGTLSSQRIEEDVSSMLISMGLHHRQNELAENLSGGMRRRLSVAIAFVGGSQTIILDEPTSGVDPVARRHIWNLIAKYKKGRTILLTTHNLDEADILSDRVAILCQGKLLCCGSPLKLKRTFGSGYQLAICKTSPDFGSDTDSGAISTSSGSDTQNNCNAASIFTFIRPYVPNVQLLEDQGNEMIFGLPYCNDDGTPNVFDQFFLELEKHQMRLGIGSYGLSCTTLEEVFMNVCLQTDAGLPITPQGHKILMLAKKVKMIKEGIVGKDTTVDEIPPGDPIQTTVANVLKKQESLVGMDAWLSKTLYQIHYSHLTGMSLQWNQFKWLVTKRFHHFRRDWRSLITCIVLPCVFVAIAMGMTLIRPPTDPLSPALRLEPALYGPDANSFFVSDTEDGQRLSKILLGPPGVGTTCLNPPPDDKLPTCQFLNGREPPAPESVVTRKEQCTCSMPEDKVCNDQYVSSDLLRYLTNSTDVLLKINGSDVAKWIISTNDEYTEKNSRYGGWTLSARQEFLPGTKDNGIAWYNNKGHHAMPSYLSSLNNVYLRALLQSNNSQNYTQYGISTYNHPLHLSKTQLGLDSLNQYVADVGIALVFLIAFSFIPAGFVIYLVKERVNEEKRLQYVSGVSPFIYWISAMFSDMVILCIPVCLSAIVIAIFNLPIYLYGHNFAATLVMLYMFGWATTPLMYIAEKFFNEASLASMILFCINNFIGMNTTICTLLLFLFMRNEFMATALYVLEYLFLAFPQYTFCRGLVDMTKSYIQAEIFIRFGDDTYVNPFCLKVLGWNIIVLAFQGVFFFMVNLLLEYMPYVLIWIERRRNTFPKDNPTEDGDVQQERQKVLNHESQGDLMTLGNLYKVFNGVAGKTVAVDRVCLSIPKGECFGLLGINGAGKTTIFRMLTGELQPTFGEVLFRNKGISSAISNGSQNIGYCPQANAVDELLTAEELLSVYAGLRGIPDVDIPLAVYKAVVQFNLQTDARNVAKTYSCGTKRKLCAAVSVMGNPDVVLMDEPTSGMDPTTRRLVWNNVRQITKEKRSVILTSHSMEECDTLCSRLAIMVNGRFQCLGSPQYLKHKFGDGYTITLRIRDQPTDWKEIFAFINNNFPGSILKAQHCTTIKFLISRTSTSLGDVFSQLESAKETMGIEDFSVTQTTLDQVFVNFVQKQADGCERDDGEYDFHGHLNPSYVVDEDEESGRNNGRNGRESEKNVDTFRKENDYQVTQF